MNRRYPLLASAAVLVVTAGLRPPLAAQERVEFNRDVRPILSDNCFACHGPDKAKRKAKLRLDDRAAAIEKGAITPGKPGESELLARILLAESDDGVMPPAESHKKLTAKQKDTLRKWVEQGAEYQPHWAYIVPTRPAVPRTQYPVHSPIDAFVRAELEKRKIAPSPEADRRTLARRLYLDLLGLPPTPEEVEAFVADKSPDAYEKLVDRLLASPHFGERLAVYWLDLVRFADTVGYHGDQNQRIFPYRDYVIDSFNRNTPFDAFTREQIAGDLLPNPTAGQLVATGFNRLNMMTREGGAQPKEYLAKYQADRVRTVGLAWLGSTFGCAECHDHKYDPITAKDFYALSAFFADVKQWGVYHDYAYTPNPELKGWSNDHPFPPEIEVESPYLKKRLFRVYKEFAEATTEGMEDWFRDEGQDAPSGVWDRETAAFRKAHPDGWATPTPTAPGAAVEADGRVVFAGPVRKGGKQTLTLKPGKGWVASVRVELLPHPKHGGRLARDKAATVTVTPSVAHRPAGGKEAKLPLFYGVADRAEVFRYSSTEPVLELLNGWRTSPAHPDQPHTAKWALDKPVRLEDGDELVVTLTGDNVGCARVSVSPFPIDDLDGVSDELRAAGFDLKAVVPYNRTPHAHAPYLLGTAAHPELFERVKSLRKELFALRGGKAWTQVTVSAAPMTVRLLPRGNWMDESGPVMQPATPGFLPGPKPADGRRLTRLDLANWIAAKENPLTARVFVNRLWKLYFGTGLSAVLEDVGAQGEPPSHPELLDWLAVEFVDPTKPTPRGGWASPGHPWDVKRMVRLLVTSATYRQDSKARPELRDADPNNRLLAFMTPRRLEAEFVRDNALAAAGLLNWDVGGPSVKPYQPDGYYANLQFPDRPYKPDADDRQYRRGVYVHWQRTFLHPMLANFDAPSREECVATRPAANTPQQALTLLNDPTFVEAARVLAEKAAAAGSDADRLDVVFRRVLARPAKAAERDGLLKFLAARRDFYGKNPDEAKKLIRVGFAPVPQTADPAELAAWASVCRVVLNLHEAITKY